jgi:hydroxyacylglutathione hydrolase
MPQVITVIDLGGANCYLVTSGAGFCLTDTGFVTRRGDLEKALERAGCRLGNLSLVILTHGDLDHAGNAAYLQKKFGAKIAVHTYDAGMAERGDIGINRKARPDRQAFVFRVISKVVALFVRGNTFEVFKPDWVITEEMSLAEYGFEARVVHLPGHSKGSLGILTAAGDLFCGDLLYHLWGKPQCLYIDDLAAFNASLDKLKQLKVKTIYPGHGKPFPPGAVL